MLKFQLVKGVVQYLKDVRFEMTKVVWPKREEVVKLTVTVLTISTLVGIYVGGLDFMFTKLLEVFVSR